MPLLAEDHAKLSTKDLLSWYFDSPNFDQDQPVYIDANDPSRYWTANQCRKTIKQLAAGFWKLGLKTGDCVCICSFNSLDYPVLANGILGFGGVFTGCNPSYTTLEMVHHLRTSLAQVVVAEPELLDTCLKAAAEVGLPRSRVLVFADKGSSAEKDYGLKSWRTLLEHGESSWPRFDDEATAKNTTAALLFSSGTTGLPKAAMLSHRNMIAEQTLLNEYKAATYHRRWLIALPMFHTAGVTGCHFGPLHSGDKMFILRRFEVDNCLQNVERHQITQVLFSPPMVQMIISSPLARKFSLKSLRRVNIGGAPLDAGSQAEMKKLLADEAVVAQAWGMTETSCVCSTVPYEVGHETSGSIGRMLPNMDSKLCDDEGNDITADDVRGELCVRGPLVCQGYYLNPEANARDWDTDGYFHTGDIVYRSSESKLWHIVDRKKELIKARGFQVSPSEVEGALLAHPDIIDAAVIGIAAKEKVDGEEPRAYINLKEGSSLSEADVRKHLEQRLARYKQCTGGIVIGKEIPKTPSGKKLKRILQEQAKKELASERAQFKL